MSTVDAVNSVKKKMKATWHAGGLTKEDDVVQTVATVES
jgi:hypothetical protein